MQETILRHPSYDKQKSPYENKSKQFKLPKPIPVDFVNRYQGPKAMQLNDPNSLYWKDLEILTPVREKKVQIILKRQDKHVHVIILERNLETREDGSVVSVFNLVRSDDETVTYETKNVSSDSNETVLRKVINIGGEMFSEFRFIVAPGVPVEGVLVSCDVNEVRTYELENLLDDVINAFKGPSDVYPIGTIKVKTEDGSPKTIIQSDLSLNMVREDIRLKEIKKVKAKLTELLVTKFKSEIETSGQYTYQISPTIREALIHNFDNIKQRFPDLNLNVIADATSFEEGRIVLKLNEGGETIVLADFSDLKS